MTPRVGTIVFGHPDWAGTFYPPHLAGPDRLAFYAKHFDTVELDGTFHATPPADHVRRWHDATPPTFRFAAKMTRAVTHDAPALTSAAARSQTLLWLDSLAHLGDKLAAVLLQFPASFTPTPVRFGELAAYLDAWPADVPVAVELRHDGWWGRWGRRTADLFKAHAAAWTVVDELPRAQAEAGDIAYEPRPAVLTGDLFYLRLLGVHEQFGRKTHERFDTTPRLTWWADRLAKLDGTRVREALVFANNDYAGHAPTTARKLRRLLGQETDAPPPTLFSE